MMRCINCGIATTRLRRHDVPTLPMPARRILSDWLGTELAENGHICHPCFLILSTGTANERVLGHTMVCLGCGKSVRDLRYHIIESESPLLMDFPFAARLQGVTSNYACHACWIRCNRRHQHDSAREDLQLTGTIQPEDALVPVSPVPPMLPTPNLTRQSRTATIILPNYKRASNTSSHCIFNACNNRSFHMIPTFMKRILLNDHNLYIPRSARVCELHLYSNQWHDLSENLTTFNSFSAHQIEDLIQISKSTGEFINFENIDIMPNHVCHYWTGRTVAEFLNLLNSLPDLNVKKPKVALAIYLAKLRTGESNRRLATIFNMPRSTLELLMKKVRNCMYQNFVPQHLGTTHINHADVVARNLRIPYALFGDPEAAPENRPAIAIFDGTYIFLQKSANYMFQKKTYSLHKYDNLVKPFLIVSCDGHIIDVVGPFPATQTDAEIMISLFQNENGPYRTLFRPNDIFILDRGFRDSLPALESYHYRVYKPESLEAGQTQLTYLQANKSRKVTLCRWVVEVVNGRFKRDFKLFRQRYFNLAAKHLMIDFKIAAAIINKYHPVLTDNPHCEQIIERALHFMNEPNHLGQFVNDHGLNRRRVMFTRINGDLPQLEHFPRFSYDELLLISLGPYQIKQSVSYYGEHIRANGVYEVEVCPELDNSEEMVLHIGGTTPYLLRGRIKSRHISQRMYYTYILFDVEPNNDPLSSLLGYYCSCVVGNRTVGCCCHVMTMIWYLGWARYQSNVTPPASFLDDILFRIVEY